MRRQGFGGWQRRAQAVYRLWVCPCPVRVGVFMSGIVGIWNLDGRPVERKLLGRLSATMSHRGLDGEDFWLDGPVGLACQLFRVTPESATEVQPLVDHSGTVLVFNGRLDNRTELLAAIKST